MNVPFGRRLLLISLLVAPACAIGAGDRLPLSYFTRHDDFGDIKIAPDGAFFAESRLTDGKGAINFYSLHPLKAVVGLRSDVGMVIAEFRWSSPTRLLYTIAERSGYLEQPTRTGEIFAVERDGRQQIAIYGYRAGNLSHDRGTGRGANSTYSSAEIVDDLDGDDRNVIISEHPWKREANPTLSSIDTYTATTTVIERLPLAEASPLLDSAHKPRFVIGYDKQGKLAVMWKPAAEWTTFELPGFRDRTVFPQRFTPDDRAVLFTGTRTEDALSALYRLDLESREVTKLYAHPEADIDDVVTDFADETVIGVRVYADKPEYHWLDAANPTAKVYQMLERAFPGQAYGITSVTQDQHLALALIHSDVNPGDYYLIDTQTREADLLVTRRSWVDPTKMRPKEIVKLEARDGLVLHGYLTRPRNEPGPYPLIVLPHGGPHGVRDAWGFDWEAQLLAHYGYAVLQVNFRGSGGYGESFLRAGYGEWGARMQDDVTDATLWAIEQKIAEKDNICIYGASYGGYAALMGAIREPALYRCAVSYAGVTDLELMFRLADIPRSARGRSYLEEVLGTDPEVLRARSPVDNADRIQVPVLLVHGKSDGRVDYAHATAMQHALKKAGKDVELMSLSGEGHGVYNEDNRDEVYGKLLAFFAAHLRGGEDYKAR